MSEQKKEEFATIRHYFDGFLDNKKARIFYWRPMEIWGKSTKQLARAKILIPENICGTDIRDLRNWTLSIVAIPKEDIKKSIEKEE